jgi:hypothetical protein
MYRIVEEHNYTSIEIENMLVWEKDIIIVILNNEIEKQNLLNEQLSRTG